MGLVDEGGGIADMLQQLARDDYVEGFVVEWKRLFGVGPDRLDAELLSRLESFFVDVDPDDVVAGGVPRRQRAVSTPEVEHPPAGPSDVAREELRPLLAGEDEIPRASFLVVLPVAVARAFELAHGGAPAPGRTPGDGTTGSKLSCGALAASRRR
jgi:hypothetical protein